MHISKIFCIFAAEISVHFCLIKKNDYTMKRILLGFVILLLSLSLQAQGQFKDVRQTYLWDVTLSMKGYNGAPNIYEKVVDVMVKDIQSITNERTEIVVIPFQDTKYCDVWRAFATEEGKADIIRHIRSYTVYCGDQSGTKHQL